MKSKILTIKPMGRTDLRALEVPTFGKTVRAMVAYIDDAPVAVAGVIHTDPYYAFANMTQAMREHPKEIVRVIQGFSDWLSENYEVVYALADVEESNAPSVLQRAGFKYYSNTVQGDVYKWHRPQFH